MGTLNQENEIAPDALYKSWEYLTIAESLNIDFSEPAAVTFADLFG
jgi:hypothetical protein